MDLKAKAMIAQLSIKGIWSAVAEDERVTAEVAAKHGVSANAGRYLKKILDPKQVPTLKAFNTSRSTLYNLHRQLTLVWNDKGGRLLPSDQYFDYMAKVGDAKQRVMEAYEAFITELPALRAKAQSDPEVNGLYRDEDWPNVEDLRAKVNIRVRIEPMADPSHFLCKLGDEEEAKIKAQVERDLFAKLAGGLADMVGRVKECVLDSQARLAKYETDSDGKVVHTFKDTAITNLREMVSNARKLNVIGDPTLAATLDDVDALLCQKDPQVLRDNFVERQKVVGDAGAIARKLANIESVLSFEADAA
jgi:hypothetical protein